MPFAFRGRIWLQPVCRQVWPLAASGFPGDKTTSTPVSRSHRYDDDAGFLQLRQVQKTGAGFTSPCRALVRALMVGGTSFSPAPTSDPHGSSQCAVVCCACRYCLMPGLLDAWSSPAPDWVAVGPNVAPDLLQCCSGYLGPMPQSEGRNAEALIAEARGRSCANGNAQPWPNF